MADHPSITRPNGKPCQPRCISANAVSDEDDWLSGVIVLGTHDVSRAQPLADQYASWQVGGTFKAARPLAGWYRDGFESGERRWITDEEHGRAGVWFREITEG